MAKLGSCFLIVRNGASIKQVNGASGLPITRIETISNCVVDRNKFGYADIYDAGKYEEFLLRDQDILMSHINSEKHLGKVAIYHQNNDEKIIHGMNLLMLRANPEIVFPQYIAYYFESPFFKRQIVSITKKSVNQASFTVTALKELTVPIVSLDKQRKIAAVLDKVSELIAKRRAQLDKLDLLVKARFVEMFGDPVSNPKDWPLCPLCNCLIKIENGKSLVCANEARAGIVPGILKLSAATYGDYRPEENKAMLDASMFLDSAEVHADDLLFTRKNTPELVGMSTYVFETPEKLMMPDLLFRLDTNHRCNKIFLWKLINHDLFRSKIKALASGSAKSMSNISKERLGNLQIIVPPIELQGKFDTFVRQAYAERRKINCGLEKLETLKKALMQEFFW